MMFVVCLLYKFTNIGELKLLRIFCFHKNAKGGGVHLVKLKSTLCVYTSYTFETGHSLITILSGTVYLRQRN